MVVAALALLVYIVMNEKKFLKLLGFLFNFEIDDDDDMQEEMRAWRKALLNYCPAASAPVILAYIAKPFVMSVIKSKNFRDMTN